LPNPHTLAIGSPLQRKYLSHDEIAAKYGAASEDLDQVVAFAQSQGLTIVETSIARRAVVVSGTVEQINRAFAIELGHYQSASIMHRGYEGAVHIPTRLDDIVEGVYGLDNRPLAKPLAKAAATDQATTPLLPAQVAKLYEFPTISAAGQTIGILEFGGGYKLTDIQDYFNNVAHLPVPNVTWVGIDGATNSPGSSDDIEVILDIAVAGSVAPGANIVVYFAPNTDQGWVDAVPKAMSDTTHNPSVLSISWGGGETSAFGCPLAQKISEAIATASMYGVTIFASSGDSGSGQGSNAEVLYPACDPWVIGCGGTTIENVSGSSFTQVAWSGSGGGISNCFPLPYWQTWAHIPPSINPKGHIGRGVPDIAGNADPNSGYMLILNGESTGPWGGTSAVAPLYAGLVALLNATLGERVGYLNYNLYAFPGPYVYDSVTSGSNGGYNAGPGWNAVTGWGSVNGIPISVALEGIGLPPALATFNGQLYMAWKGMEFDERIFWNTFNGASWTAQQQVPNVATSSGVSLAVFNGKLYMAWKGMEADQGIYWSSFDGTSWAPQQQIPGVGTSTGPRLAVFNNVLYAAWKGIEGDQSLWWSRFNGTNWAPQQQIPAVWSSVGPALAVFNNVLFAVWKGMYGDQSLWWSTFNGASWAPQQQIPNAWSSEGPSLAVFNNVLFATWKGMYGDQSLWWSTFNGASWAPQQQIPGVWSSIGPNINAFGNALYMVWKGKLGDQRIWWTTFNGWAPEQVIPGVETSTDLVAQAK
jgi:kumamolisin